MKRIILAATLVLCSTNAMAEQPALGDLFQAPSTDQPDVFDWKFRGWTYSGRGPAIGIGRFAIFQNGNSFMIAATEEVAPSKERHRDGVQRITATKIVTKAADEEQAVICDLITLSPVLAFYRGNMVRGFFVIGEEIVEQRWIAGDGECVANVD